MLDNSVRNYHKSLKQGFHKHHLLDTPRLISTLTLWQNYYIYFYCKSQVADGFMPRKVLDVRKECVRLSCQRQTKSPLGLSVGGLFAYRHTPERLTSRTPWNKSSAYVSDTHYKSEIFKSIILSVLYHIRHFNVLVVKRKTLTFVKVYRLWGVVDNNHFVVIQLNFFYEVIY